MFSILYCANSHRDYTPKEHYLLHHTYDRATMFLSIGLFSEQACESVHHQFNLLKDRYKVYALAQKEDKQFVAKQYAIISQVKLYLICNYCYYLLASCN